MAEQKKFIVKNGLIAADLTYPTTDGRNKQAIVTDAAGNLTFDNAVAEYIEVAVKNVSGGTLTKGTPVHQTGTSGQSAEVIAARADTASAMPAVGVLNETLADQAEGYMIITGRIQNVDTSAFNEGDVIYVGETGGYTSVKPAGETNIIQNLGIVTKVNASSGAGVIYGSGRGAATPNLDDGKIFIGNDSNYSSTATLDTTIVPEGNNLYYTTGRHDSDFDVRLAIKTTDDLTEGSNQYYTTARANTAIDARVTKTFVDNLNVDADTLDGLNSTQFLRADSDATISANLVVDSDLTISGVLKGPEQFYIDPAPIDSDGGTVIIRGNLTVQGTQTIINSTTLSINDLNIILADSAADSAAADGAGITVAGASATMTYDAAANSWVFNKAPYYNTDRILTTADEGSGNGLDADTLDGNEYEDIISEATALAIALG